MFSKLTFIILLIILPGFLFGQNCFISISGKVQDASTGEPLEDAIISFGNNTNTYFSNKKGLFKLTNLCASSGHLVISHLGCTPEKIYLDLKKDTVLTIKLHHHSELINEVEVHGITAERSIQQSSAIDAATIVANSNKTLTQAIEEMAGVSMISNGGAISKPVIQGMWGNRVSILNNGIAQAGQQWGIDHAPEIDPFVADHISVVKGASALAYPGASLGGVILVEPSVIAKEPHVHGGINYIFQTNGRGHTINAKAEQWTKYGAWRVVGTLKYMGDRKSPNYYLTNTGNREADWAASYQKDFSNRFKVTAYYSFFQTEIGILRGSHISNSTDLASALSRDEPFFTSPDFSYTIDAPSQKVQHHLAKLEGKYLLNENQFIAFKYGGQLNNRKEFDVRRAGRSDDPSLSMQQQTHFLEAVYENRMPKNWLLKTGLQFNFIDNSNDNSSTGRLPLIPDYRSSQYSLFAIAQRTGKNLLYEFGARADFKDLYVVNITNTFPREIEHITHQFANLNFSAGLRYNLFGWVDTKLDVGLVQRQPEVNELYSSGLHQGLASIEYGNPNLIAERSLKAVLSANKSINRKFFIQASGYIQRIADYIYLAPADEFELTISGSFPVFVYNQTDAQIMGADLLLSYSITKHLKATGTLSLLRGTDITHQSALIYMPANNFLGRVSYAFADGKSWKNNALSISGKAVAKQWRVDADQDFTPPPDGYFLLGLQASTSYKSFDFSLHAENLLNTVYRDYLNRLRYFADDLGINISARVSFNF